MTLCLSAGMGSDDAKPDCDATMDSDGGEAKLV
jgi:hypothetical protein